MAANNKYIVLDLDKGTYDNDTTTYVNLTPHFQGRVADSLATVNLQFRHHGLPQDLTNYNVGFEGIDPNGKRFAGVGWAAYDLPDSREQVGKVNFYWPAGMFQVEGQWDPNGTYFYIDDGKGQKISTVGVQLNVLPNLVEMGVNAKPFETDMDRAVAQLQSYVDQKMKEIGNITNRFDQISDATTALKTELDTYTQLIRQNAVPTVEEMHNYVSGVDSGIEWSGSLDSATEPKVYLIPANVPGAPSESKNAGGVLKTFGSSPIVQMFVDSDGNEFIRVKNNGTWARWYMTTQFGSDADLYPINPDGGSATTTDADKYGGNVSGGGQGTVITVQPGGATATTSSQNAAASGSGTQIDGQSGNPQNGTNTNPSTDADKYGGNIGGGGSVIVQH